MTDKSTPPELKAAANAARQSNLPLKSKAKYEKAYDALLAWCKKKDVPDAYFTPNVLIAYFQDEKASGKAPTTLWSTYSKLKKTLQARNAVNIDDKPFKIVKELLKGFGVDYQPKKSKVFLLEEVYRFAREADDREFLAMKAIALIGIVGALRHSELLRANARGHCGSWQGASCSRAVNEAAPRENIYRGAASRTCS